MNILILELGMEVKGYKIKDNYLQNYCDQLKD